jgi:uncharacterized small protein (DUF1192 family)
MMPLRQVDSAAVEEGNRRLEHGWHISFVRWRRRAAVSFGPGRADVTIADAAVTLSAKGGEMPAIDPDDLPKKKIVHELGQDLSSLSVAELGERIGLLKDEIARLETEMVRKRASQNVADAFFKK